MSANHRNGKSRQLTHYIEKWDEYFLSIAVIVARKSKDPKCQVGAVIVSPDKLVLSTGFNGLPRGVYDDERILKDTDEKLKQICHAEVNAILNAARTGVSLKGCSIFVNKFPCLSCCNAIVQTGIVRIYTHDHRYWDDDPVDKEHVRKWATLKQADVQVVAPFHPDFGPIEPVTLEGIMNGASNGAKKRAAANGAKKPPRKDRARPAKRTPRNGNSARATSAN
jgi:dCMP deaminase